MATTQTSVITGASTAMPDVKTMNEIEFDFKNGSISLTCQYNKKLSICYVGIFYDTTEKSLLNTLLHKYIHEKVQFNGCNVTNEIYYSYATCYGIVFVSPEKKVINNIVNIYAYIVTKKLQATELKQMTVNEARYEKLHKDVAKMKVIVTGNCLGLLRASLLGMESKKIPKLRDGLNKVNPAAFPNVEIKEISSYPYIDYNVNDKSKLDVIISLENVAFVFNNKGIQFLEPSEAISNKLQFAYPRLKMKAFLVSCGTANKPPPNDPTGKKWLAKKRYVLQCINALLDIVCGMRNFEFQLKNYEDIKMDMSDESNKHIKNLRKIILENRVKTQTDDLVIAKEDVKKKAKTTIAKSKM